METLKLCSLFDCLSCVFCLVSLAPEMCLSVRGKNRGPSCLHVMDLCISRHRMCVCVCVEIDLALALKLCSFVDGLSYGLCISQDIAYIFVTYYPQRSLRNLQKMPSTPIENGAKIHPRAQGDPPWQLLGLKGHNYFSNRLLKWTHKRPQRLPGATQRRSWPHSELTFSL